MLHNEELKKLAKKSDDAIAIHYVSLDDLQDTFLDKNSKKHDTSKIIESIERYGFRDPIAFDLKLNNGNGGIVEGNGRLEALMKMQGENRSLPRGIKEGWLVPVLFGVNAVDESEAIAFSIEHNWSVTWGSELELDQVMTLFDSEALQEQLTFLNSEQAFPISFDDDLDDILQELNLDKPQKETTQNADIDEINDSWGIIINLDDEKQQLELLEELTNKGYNCKALM